MSDDDVLLDVVRHEMSEGVGFLAAKGYPGAELTIGDPDPVGRRTVELGGRFAARADRSAHAVVEIDAARVGWRLQADVSIWPDEAESSTTTEVGTQRVIDPLDADSQVRVLIRRAYVSLWEQLDGRATTAGRRLSDPAPRGANPEERTVAVKLHWLVPAERVAAIRVDGAFVATARLPGNEDEVLFSVVISWPGDDPSEIHLSLLVQTRQLRPFALQLVPGRLIEVTEGPRAIARGAVRELIYGPEVTDSNDEST